MLQQNTFQAPWSRSLKITTLLSCVILLGVVVAGATLKPVDSIAWDLSMKLAPLALIVITAFFSISSYQIAGNQLVIQRLGWQSTINLADLESVEADPRAMSKSLRLFGNGGLFCFAGLFTNKHLGRYRAFATNPRNAVVLRFPRRTIVVTPEEPDSFVEAVVKRVKGF